MFEKPKLTRHRDGRGAPIVVGPVTIAVLLVVIACFPGAVGLMGDVFAKELGATSSGQTEPAADQTTLEKTLSVVQVISEEPDAPGYERSCGSGKGCVFGPAWTDAQDAPGGRNGCGTRDDVLGRDLRGVEYRDGSACIVVAGELADPYTGQTIAFAKSDAAKVQVDHIYPLAAAWRRGASTWPLEKRVEFANDVALNLIAVDGSANSSKGDRTPGEWMPINGAYRCTYLARFVEVAVAYELPITQADVDAVDASGCVAAGTPR